MVHINMIAPFLTLFFNNLGFFGRDCCNAMECNNENIAQQNAFVRAIFWNLFPSYSTSNII
jgi:hypothetical protein